MAQAFAGSSGAALASASSQTSGSGRQQLKLQRAVGAGARKGRTHRRGLAVSAQSQDDGSLKYVSLVLTSDACITQSPHCKALVSLASTSGSKQG